MIGLMTAAKETDRGNDDFKIQIVSILMGLLKRID